MTWVKLDDAFPDHPKVVGLSDAAFRLYVAGLCYSSTYLTDGFISQKVAGRLTETANETILIELSHAGLWKECEEGWAINDFLAYNPSRAEIADTRRKATERQRRWRAGHSVTDSVTNDVTNAAVGELVRVPRPDPTRSIKGPRSVAYIGSGSTAEKDAGEEKEERASADQWASAISTARDLLKQNHPAAHTSEDKEAE